KLPQRASLIYGQPIPKPYAQLFCSFHTTDAGSEFRAEEPRIRGLVGKSSDGRKPYIDRAWCQQLILKMYSIPCDDRFLDRQAWFCAIPTDKIINRSPIASSRFSEPSTDEQR